MAGVASRRYADGCHRVWYIDRTKKQIFAKGTCNRRESLQWAKTLEAQQRGFYLGIFPEPSAAEVHRHDPIDEVIAEYSAWGGAQGGLNHGPWSTTHARNIRVRLTYWKEKLGLKTLGDLQGKLPEAEACMREFQVGHENMRTKRTDMRTKPLMAISRPSSRFLPGASSAGLSPKIRSESWTRSTTDRWSSGVPSPGRKVPAC